MGRKGTDKKEEDHGVAASGSTSIFRYPLHKMMYASQKGSSENERVFMPLILSYPNDSKDFHECNFAGTFTEINLYVHMAEIPIQFIAGPLVDYFHNYTPLLMTIAGLVQFLCCFSIYMYPHNVLMMAMMLVVRKLFVVITYASLYKNIKQMVQMTHSLHEQDTVINEIGSHSDVIGGVLELATFISCAHLICGSSSPTIAIPLVGTFQRYALVRTILSVLLCTWSAIIFLSAFGLLLTTRTVKAENVTAIVVANSVHGEEALDEALEQAEKEAAKRKSKDDASFLDKLSGFFNNSMSWTCAGALALTLSNLFFVEMLKGPIQTLFVSGSVEEDKGDFATGCNGAYERMFINNYVYNIASVVGGVFYANFITGMKPVVFYRYMQTTFTAIGLGFCVMCFTAYYNEYPLTSGSTKWLFNCFYACARVVSYLCSSYARYFAYSLTDSAYAGTLTAVLGVFNSFIRIGRDLIQMPFLAAPVLGNAALMGVTVMIFLASIYYSFSSSLRPAAMRAIEQMQKASMIVKASKDGEVTINPLETDGRDLENATRNSQHMLARTSEAQRRLSTNLLNKDASNKSKARVNIH